MHSPPKLPNMEEMEEEQADALGQAFDLDYDVAQAFCSHIVPKAVLLFTGEALDNDMDFEPKGGEVDNNDEEYNKGGYDEGTGETGLPFPVLAKTMGKL